MNSMTIINRMGCLCLLWFVPVMTVTAANEADVLAGLSLPANTQLQSVSSSGQYNGHIMAIAALSSSDESSVVAAFFKQLWHTGSDASTPGFVENTIPGWQLISRLQGDFHIVVQLHQDQSRDLSINRNRHSLRGGVNTGHTSGTQGFVSVARVSHTIAPSHRGPFSNLQRLSINQTNDGADTSQLSVYASPTSLDRTHELYVPKLQQAGWHVLADTRVDQGWVTLLTRDQSRLELSFLDSSEFGSVLVAHELSSK